jgi:hypothetical protein
LTNDGGTEPGGEIQLRGAQARKRERQGGTVWIVGFLTAVLNVN